MLKPGLLLNAGDRLSRFDCTYFENKHKTYKNINMKMFLLGNENTYLYEAIIDFPSKFASFCVRKGIQNDPLKVSIVTVKSYLNIILK